MNTIMNLKVHFNFNYEYLA